MRRQAFKNSHGFTLFEILVSMVLLSAIGMLALGSFNNSARVTTGKQNTAANLARQNLENLKNAVGDVWWGAANERLSPGVPAVGLQPPAATLDGIVFTPSYSVTNIDIDGDGVPDARRVTTNVNWTP